MRKVILLLIFIFLFFPLKVEAKEGQKIEYYMQKYNVGEVLEVSELEEIPSVIFRAVKNCDNVAIRYTGKEFDDISIEMAKELFDKSFKFGGGEWYRGNVLAFDYGVGNFNEETYMFFKISYRSNKSELRQMERIFDDIAKKAIENPSFKNMTDAEKARLVYDYVIRIYEYDDSLNDASYYPYGAIFLNDRKAVCQCYSLTYSYLCNALGVESKMVFNEDVTHSFNLTKIDGRWYYVDCTWGEKNADKWFLFSYKDDAELVYDYYNFSDLDISLIPYSVRSNISTICKIMQTDTFINMTAIITALLLLRYLIIVNENNTRKEEYYEEGTAKT